MDLLDKRARTPQELRLGDHAAKLFFPVPSRNNPPWVKVIGPYAPEARELQNHSHSAIVMIEVDDHVFAATFGRAQHLLPRDSMLPNFGLRTVVNAVSPDNLHGLDMKRFESLAVHRRVHTPKGTPIHHFGIDWTRDLLRAVTGTPTDSNFARRVSGADALVLCGNHRLEDMPRLCGEAFRYYESNDYQSTRWSYIDFLQPERDSEIVDQLDHKLAEAIVHLDQDQTPHLALDEFVDDAGIVSYSFQPSKRHETDTLDIKQFQVFIRQHEQKTPLEWLRTGIIKISFADAPTTSIRHRIYRSLDWSTHHRGRLYVFTSGIWLRVDQKYSERLTKYISDLGDPTFPLPPAQANVMLPDKSKGNDEKGEGLYIQSVCSDRFSFLKIHPRNFKSDLMNEPVEPCDILGSKGALYYIKRGGESGGLSHLFTQGLTAALTLHNDAGYRRQFRAAIASAVRDDNSGSEEAELLVQEYSALVPEDGITPSSLEICFIVIRNRKGNWPDDLPYLSKISLYEASRRLQEAKFDVRLQCVTPARSDVCVRKPSQGGRRSAPLPASSS